MSALGRAQEQPARPPRAVCRGQARIRARLPLPARPPARAAYLPRRGFGPRSAPAPRAMPRERRERDAQERDGMKEDSSADVSVRSRKRKANVAVSWDSNAVCENPCSLIPTPDKEEDELVYPTCGPQSIAPSRASPLPVLNWANREEVWKIMLNKEKTYLRDKHFLQRHPLLQPKMRAVLLDWLMEVCEVYKLHRETFYLAQDFFDRYMATQQNVVKTLLQLIGISSLFIAAKLEEIYPPKLHQFAYVTDGACSGAEILTMELIIMKALKWRLSPLTIVSWLNVYLQVAYLNDLYEVLLPQYPQQIFIQIAELLDLCVLDVGCLEFSYGVLAASALYHFSSSELMQRVSGYQWCDIEKCVKWMVPFAMVIRETGSSKLKHFRGVPAEDAHNIQTHLNSLDLLDKAQAKKAILSEQNRISPPPTGVLTPPQSSKKQSSGQGTV
uniref:G1/S-specific cyclin-E1 n=1 Tax=Equus asinus TaxID=9793 RepID=A0A9L0IEA9_EQUAS|nr:G1/S-specific cyclin-E1 isoform X2 [Equus asinus]